MRPERTVQATILEVFAGHQIGCELKTISDWLDGQRALVSLVVGDLRREGVSQTGRRGLTAETVLRCALLKQQRQLSYEELAFHLEDSASFRAFARLPLAWSPKLESDRLKARLGAALIERDLLHEKIALLEADRPFVRRRRKP
jgi:IS5 family transposase